MDQVDAFCRTMGSRRGRIFQILGKQLHIQTNGRQRIPNLMGQSSGQARNLGVLVHQSLDRLRSLLVIGLRSLLSQCP